MLSTGVELASQPTRVLDEPFRQGGWIGVPRNREADTLDSVSTMTQPVVLHGFTLRLGPSTPFHDFGHGIVIITVRANKYYSDTHNRSGPSILW